MPKRIQRRRVKGWRMPTGAVYVGRPTRFGNPYRGTLAVFLFRQNLLYAGGPWAELRKAARQLRGKDLVCWCPIGECCHADVLLEVANA